LSWAQCSRDEAAGELYRYVAYARYNGPRDPATGCPYAAGTDPVGSAGNEGQGLVQQGIATPIP